MIIHNLRQPKHRFHKKETIPMKCFFLPVLLFSLSCHAQTDLMSPSDMLIKAIVGKFAPQNCDSKTQYEFHQVGNSIQGDIRGAGRLMASIEIPLASAKFHGVDEGFYKLSYSSRQENFSNKSVSEAEVLISTNFKVRRVVNSKVNDVVVINNGIVLSSGQYSLDMVRCDP